MGYTVNGVEGEMTQNVFVLGGNYRESLYWVSGQPYPRKVRYIILDEKEDIMGHEDMHGYLIGTWSQRKDIKELLGYMLLRCSCNTALRNAYESV
jgi:hypothetical protein